MIGIGNYISSYQQKWNYLILLGVGSYVIIILIMGIRIWKQYDQYTELLKLHRNLENAPAEIERLTTQLNTLSKSAVETYEPKSILSLISRFSNENNLLIESFPNANVQKRKELTIISHELSLSGEFKKMIELLFLLEREKKLGVVNFAKFFTEKNPQTRTESLKLHLVLRNIMQ